MVEAETGTKNRCEPEKTSENRLVLPANGESLAFIKVRLADVEGNWNRQEEKAVTIKLEGGAVLQACGSANPSCEGSYNAINVSRLEGTETSPEECVQESTWETYDGAVMAVIRAGKVSGETKITITAEGCAEESLVLVCGERNI